TFPCRAGRSAESETGLKGRFRAAHMAHMYIQYTTFRGAMSPLVQNTRCCGKKYCPTVCAQGAAPILGTKRGRRPAGRKDFAMSSRRTVALLAALCLVSLALSLWAFTRPAPLSDDSSQPLYILADQEGRLAVYGP